MKTWPNIPQGGLEMQPLARWSHTQPHIIMVEIKGNKFWWTARGLLHHIESTNINRKQKGTWSFAPKGRWSKETFALSVSFELLNVSGRDYDCLGSGNEVNCLISCLILSAAHLTSQLTSHNFCNTAFLFILLFTFNIFTPLSLHTNRHWNTSKIWMLSTYWIVILLKRWVATGLYSCTGIFSFTL